MKKIFVFILFLYCLPIYSQTPNNPSPIDNGINILLSDELTFSSGASINAPTDAEYKIYFDTNSNPTTLYSTETLSSLDYFFGIDVSVSYQNLAENTNYYWKVEVLDSTGNILATSPIWSFQTKVVAIGDGGVFNGSVQLETQEEVDAFATNLYTSITGDLTIGVWAVPNYSITDLSSLTNLTSIDGSLNIYENRILSTTNGLDNIASIGGNLEVYVHPLLNDFQLPSLLTVGGSITIGNSDLITNLNGLSNLSSIGGSLMINNNPSITTLDGLSSLNSINYTLIIYNNDSLTNIGLNSLNSVGNISIEENEILQNLDGLENINAQNRNIFISFNDNIVTLNGLNFHNSIGSLYLSYNNSLSDLNALLSLDNINGTLNINNNNSIIHLNGFTNVDNIFGIGIGNNVNLYDFCGLSNLMSNNYTGSYGVSGNAYNPTQQDIINGNCSTLSVNEFTLETVKLHPNPTTDFINIQSNFDINSVEIYSLHGQKVLAIENKKTIDISSLSKGIYFLKVKTVKGEITKKVVKH